MRGRDLKRERHLERLDTAFESREGRNVVKVVMVAERRKEDEKDEDKQEEKVENACSWKRTIVEKGKGLRSTTEEKMKREWKGKCIE